MTATSNSSNNHTFGSPFVDDVVDRTKRLHRSRSNKRLGGVCGGIAKTFDLDPTIVRVVAVVLLFTTGVGALAYAVAWAVLPLEDDVAREGRARGEKSRRNETCRHTGRGRRFLGGVALAIGLIALCSAMPGLSKITWPLVLIALGYVALTSKSAGPKSPMPPTNPSGPEDDFLRDARREVDLVSTLAPFWPPSSWPTPSWPTNTSSSDMPEAPEPTSPANVHDNDAEQIDTNPDANDHAHNKGNKDNSDNSDNDNADPTRNTDDDDTSPLPPAA